MCNFPTELSVTNENVSFREYFFFLLIQEIILIQNSRKHHNSENSKPEINPPDQWQNKFEFLF